MHSYNLITLRTRLAGVNLALRVPTFCSSDACARI